jgi:hypothetical protein
MKIRKRINAADQAYIEANLDKTPEEIRDMIELDTEVIIAYMADCIKKLPLKQAKLKAGSQTAVTFVDGMDDVVDKDRPRTGLNADYIFRRKNKK